MERGNDRPDRRKVTVGLGAVTLLATAIEAPASARSTHEAVPSKPVSRIEGAAIVQRGCL